MFVNMHIHWKSDLLVAPTQVLFNDTTNETKIKTIMTTMQVKIGYSSSNAYIQLYRGNIPAIKQEYNTAQPNVWQNIQNNCLECTHSKFMLFIHNN